MTVSRENLRSVWGLCKDFQLLKALERALEEEETSALFLL